jgi:hypothetical protein
MAERAIRGYLQIAARHLQANDDSKARYITRHLERALILAGQIKNDALRAEVIQRHGETFDVIIAQKQEPISPCSDLLTSMLTEAKHINLNDVNARLDALDTWMNQHPNDVDALFREAVSNLRIDVARIQNDQEAVRGLRLQQARALEAEGDTMEATGAAAMIVQSRFQQALRRFADLGAANDIDRLKGKLVGVNKRTVGELKQISSEVAVPTEHLNELANYLQQFNVRQAIQIISLSGWWIPSVTQAREYVSKMKKVTPLRYLASKVLLDQDGNYRMLSQGPERDRHDLLEHIYQSIFIDAHFPMRVAFETLRKMGATPDDFLAVLGQAPWLDPGRLEVLREAFAAHLRRHYVSLIHILIPQLEGAVRDLARGLGESAVSARAGRMTPQTLDTMLQYPSIQQSLGEDFVMTLQALLTDDVGLMIRHRAMHGNYSDISQFDQGKAEVLIYLFLHISRYEIPTQSVKTNSDPKTPTHPSGASQPPEPPLAGGSPRRPRTPRDGRPMTTGGGKSEVSPTSDR